MSRARVTLPMRLTGVVRARDVQALLAPAPQALAAAPPASVGDAAAQTLKDLTEELSKRMPALQARGRETLAEIARAGIELAIVLAERLVGEALAANRQRLD